MKIDGIDVFFDDSECDANALYICLVNVISSKFADNFQCGLDFDFYESYQSSVSCVHVLYVDVYSYTYKLGLFCSVNPKYCGKIYLFGIFIISKSMIQANQLVSNTRNHNHTLHLFRKKCSTSLWLLTWIGWNLYVIWKIKHFS